MSTHRRRSSRRSNGRSREEPTHTIVYKERSETKTNLFFCYIEYRGMFLQMMYYEQEGRIKKDIMTDVVDSDEEEQRRFIHYFRSSLEKRNIPEYFINMLVEEL